MEIAHGEKMTIVFNLKKTLEKIPFYEDTTGRLFIMERCIEKMFSLEDVIGQILKAIEKREYEKNIFFLLLEEETKKIIKDIFEIYTLRRSTKRKMVKIFRPFIINSLKMDNIYLDLSRFILTEGDKKCTIPQ